LETAAFEAVIVAVSVAGNPDVVTEKVARVVPAGTVTATGGVANALLELRLTTNPPTGALSLMRTVPVEAVPLVTVVGESVREVRVGAFTVRLALKELAPAEAVTLAVSVTATAEVETVNCAPLVPAGITTVAGTVAKGLLEARLTVNPPPGARPLSLTLPMELVPPVTAVGVRLREARLCARASEGRSDSAKAAANI
jgi:hypothetical protein